MATNILEIYNLALIRLGEDRLAAIDDDSDPRRKLDAIYNNILEQVTVGGPEKGWKFTKTKLPVSIDSHTISSILLSFPGPGLEGTTKVTTVTNHNLVTGDYANISDTTPGDYDGEHEVTVINDSSFSIEETYTIDATAGTVAWTSGDYAYRYAIPTAAKRVVSISINGVEIPDWMTRGEWILTNLEDDKIWVEYVQSITDTTLFPAHFTKVLYMSLAIELSYNLIQSSTHSERLLTELEETILPKAIALDEKEKYVAESNDDWAEAGR